MGKFSRDKGKKGELELAHILQNELGVECCRNLAQAREGGCDIVLEPYRIEVKRRSRIGTIYDWIGQAYLACAGRPGARPLVACRADGRPWLAIMPLDEALRLMREEVARGGAHD